MSNLPVVEVSELTREFGAFRAVNSLSFCVRPGEIYGLLGPNGAGKTTTLRMLAGLLTPSSGHVTVMGVCPSLDPMRVRRAMGYLTGDTALYDRLTPRELLRFFGTLNNQESAETNARIESLSQELGLNEFIDRRCEKLSTGQRQRTAIARALIHDPPLLVLDEPTASLDVVSARFILERLKSAASDGKGVLFSTHHLSEAELICDRIGVLHQGCLLAEGSVAELTSLTDTATLTEAFLALIDSAEMTPDACGGEL